MSRWNREAALLGIPDLPEAAFQHVGDGKIKPQGGGGGSQTSTNYTTNVPEYAKQPFMEMIGKGAALSEAPYQAYGGERVAQFTPMQQQAFQGVGSQQVAGQIGQATGLAGAASQIGLGAGNYQTGSFNPLAVNAPSLNNFMMGPAQQVGSQSFLAPGTAGSYMSPYMQQVVDIQKREAGRQSDIRGTQEAAQMTKAGAFGGARDAIMRAERERNLGQQMSDIQATGSQAAFQQAQQQFNAEQDAAMRASMANQQAGLTTGQANLQSLLQTQGLGAQTGMQAQTANQQALADAQKMYEQSRQFGAGLGLEGAQLALQGAGQLGQLGQTQFGQQMDIYGAQQKMGAEQQSQLQRILDQQYTDFQQQRDYPYQQLGFLSDLLRGTGSSTRSIYSTPQPSGLQTVAGLGSALYGASSLKAKGGEVKGYAAGGGITGLLGDQQLQKEAQQPRSPMMGMAAQEELADRGAMRQAAALQQPMVLPPDDEAPTREELMQILDMALAEGDLETAQAAQEMLSQMGAGVAALGEPDITEEGIAMAAGGPVSFAEGQTVRSPYERALKEQQERDRETARRLASGVERGLQQYSAAGADIAAMPIRGVAGAIDTAIVRPVRALGADIPYVSPYLTPEGADVNSKTPYYDLVRGKGPEAQKPAGMPGRSTGIGGPTAEQMQEFYAAEAAKAKAAPPTPAAPAAKGSGQSASAGLASLVRVAAPAAGSEYPFDADATQRQLVEGQNRITEAERVARQGDIDAKKAEIEARGIYGEGREARIQEGLASIENDKDRAKGMAIMQAGLAILAADPAKGAWSAIGTGALQGLGAYKGDVEKLATRREGLLTKMDELEDIRRQESVADSKELRELGSAYRRVEVEGAKEVQGIAKEMGITVKPKIAEAVFREMNANARSNAEIEARTRIANAQIAAEREGRLSIGGVPKEVLTAYTAAQERVRKQMAEVLQFKVRGENAPGYAEAYATALNREIKSNPFLAPYAAQLSGSTASSRRNQFEIVP